VPDPGVIFDAFMNSSLLMGWIVLGVAVGFIVGAVPGFSSSNALVIMLPVLIFMDVTTAIVLMTAVYCGAEMGGSVPAILVNIPGTPGAVATCFDGYGMALEGKAALALSISAASSAFGGLLTTVATLIALPFLAVLALQFATVQNLIIVLFGIVLIAHLAAENPLKGLAAGMAGLLFGAIGPDPVYGQPRATLGLLDLYGGVPVIPALIGIFALTEVFWMLGRGEGEQKSAVPTQALVTYRAAIDGFIFTLRNWGNLIRSSVVGLIVGLLPGVGGNVASLVAYQQATIFNRSDRYGKGEPNGVLAAECANNAQIAGALIPLFTLALPGSATIVIILTVLQAHGLLLGPQLMVQHPDVPFTIISSMVFANVVIAAISFLLIPICTKVTRVPARFLAPSILMLSLLGAYAARQSGFDMGVALFFGIVGYLMRRGAYPIQPLILGLVLSPYVEEFYSRALRLGNGDFRIFVSDPLSVFLWVLLLLALFGPLLPRLRRAAPLQSALRKLRT
jgi:putative tricarboxylic transport membrane protein